MRRILSALAAGAMLVSTNAGAVGVGGELYVRARDTRVLEKPDLKAKVVTTLQPGAVVTWQGADAKVKQIHAISGTSGGKPFKGFTLQQNLTPNKPQEEVTARSNGKPMDAQAFASSGAATKALSEAGLKYTKARPDTLTLAKGIMTAEGVAATVTKDEAQTALAAKMGGAK